MSNVGLKISKPNVDVKTADDKDLVWSSNLKTFKIYRTVIFEGYGSKLHGLDYAPTFFAFKKIQGGGIIQAGYGYNYLGFIEVLVDDTSVYYEEVPISPEDQVTEKVYVILCVDPLNE